MTGESVILGAILLISMSAQSPSEKIIEIREPRPLAKAVLILEREYGKSISYEDVEDILEMDSRGVLSMEVHEEGSLLGKDPSDALQTLLQMHQANGNGVFTLKKDGDAYFIVPVQFRGKGDLVIKASSPLDGSITFPEQKRTGLETMKTICEAITKQTGVEVGLGLVPTNFMYQRSAVVGANGEPARTVILRAFSRLATDGVPSSFQLPKRQLSWHMYFDRVLKNYTFNVHLVQ